MTVKPRNTTAEMYAGRSYPNFDSGPGIIEKMERQGQAELAESDALPSLVDSESKAAMESWGFTFGEPIADDPIFMPATLPKGWRVKSADHAMWSDILDDQGRTRASIFYKAAFYDRRAHMRTVPRYEIKFVGDGNDLVHVLDNKNGEILAKFETPKDADVYGPDSAYSKACAWSEGLPSGPWAWDSP